MHAKLLALIAGTAILASPVLTSPLLAQAPLTESANVPVKQTNAMASNLVGLDVYNAGNEDVGEIEDLVLDSDMNVRSLVLSVGGFLGVGSKYVVVPPSAVKVSFDNSAKEWKGSTTLTREQLNTLGEFKYEGKFSD
ncbi:PRC-barrel domain-containing protein [Xanthobacter sediminis]